MVDHFIDITYVHLTRSTNQEENLTVKEALKIWAATFGVKVNRYHKDIGRFSEQPFRSEIEDSNQTIKVFGVGYYHQNDIVERKIKTLTLGSRTLIIHEKQYFPEARTIEWNQGGQLRDYSHGEVCRHNNRY